jgi:hypothetical protein
MGFCHGANVTEQVSHVNEAPQMVDIKWVTSLREKAKSVSHRGGNSRKIEIGYSTRDSPAAEMWLAFSACAISL